MRLHIHVRFAGILNVMNKNPVILEQIFLFFPGLYQQKARLCLKYWSGELNLPTKQQMQQDFEAESERRIEKGGNIRKSHLLDMDQVS